MRTRHDDRDKVIYEHNNVFAQILDLVAVTLGRAPELPAEGEYKSFPTVDELDAEWKAVAAMRVAQVINIDISEGTVSFCGRFVSFAGYSGRVFGVNAMNEHVLEEL